MRDESDKDGMRIVIELRRGEVSEVILNNLYKHTQMQNVFGINMVALVDGQPRLLNIKQILQAFVIKPMYWKDRLWLSPILILLLS